MGGGFVEAIDSGFQRGAKPGRVGAGAPRILLESGRLPQVSWLLPGVAENEHPGYSTPGAGEGVARQIVEALVNHPRTWSRTALFISWDEDGGFFDHVPPPTAPSGSSGEFLPVAKLPPAAEGTRGPIGLGFRVPMIVVALLARRTGLLAGVRSHLDASLPRDPVPGAGAEPHPNGAGAPRGT